MSKKNQKARPNISKELCTLAWMIEHGMSVVDWVNGEAVPNAEVARRICEAMRTAADKLDDTDRDDVGLTKGDVPPRLPDADLEGECLERTIGALQKSQSDIALEAAKIEVERNGMLNRIDELIAAWNVAATPSGSRGDFFPEHVIKDLESIKAGIRDTRKKHGEFLEFFSQHLRRTMEKKFVKKGGEAE